MAFLNEPSVGVPSYLLKEEHKSTKDPIGIYIHVPFCDGKCPYCDFFSLRGSEERMDQYTESVISRLKAWGSSLCRPADTLYFGGGTPSLLGAPRLLRITQAAREAFSLEHAEITVEVNPSGQMDRLFYGLAEGGINRLSLGLQSANEEELRLLGRRHTVQQAYEAVRAAQRAGFHNISLDLMIAIQGQTPESLCRSVAFCAELEVPHLSAYLLKIEEGTLYGKQKELLHLPSEDSAADLYLLACETIEKAGYFQYEISNFCKPGFQSRHNLKYWNAQEYLGIGPAAHSLLNGRRFFYPRSLQGFLNGKDPQEEGLGGDLEEYTMLRLRLTDGLTEKDCQSRFGCSIPEKYRKRAARYCAAGLTQCDTTGIRLTRRGFLVSNLLLSEILG